ncbi:GNAT family N-acetyltransferase [Angustibacter aerolatus]
MSDDAAAVRAFVLRLARAEATSVVDVPGGIGVRHALYPASYEHNRLLLHEPLPSSQALAAADDVLGAAGLPHRRVDWLGDGPPDVGADGLEWSRSVTMRLGDGPPLPTGDAREVPFATVRPSVREGWLRDLPDLSPDAADQLTDRRLVTAVACDLSWHAVVEQGRVVSSCDLRLLRVDGTLLGQVEDVVTEPAARGRGLARAVVGHAVETARAAGAAFTWLEADRDDFPRALYRRLGFEEIGAVTTATRPT